MNSDDKNNKNVGIIKNAVFLNTKKNKLKKNLDFEKIIIVVYEIMENIIYLEYDIDYLIAIYYDSKNDSFDFDDIDIFLPSQFNQIDPFYEQIALDKGYFEPQNAKKVINILDSTHELLNSKEDKKDQPNIRRIKSGKIKTTSKKKEIKDDFMIINKNNSLKNSNNIINHNEENIIKQLNIKNEDEKEEKEDEENIEEKEIKKQFKNYFFNDNQMIINLNNYKGESIKPVGLINPSIYCFMICILQSLISIPELNFFFLSKIYLISSLFNNDNNSNLDEGDIENNYPICTSYQYFIKIYLLSKKNYIQIPKNLFRICNKLLGGMRMHDSQEFFVCFLEALQQELNPPNKSKNKKVEKNKKSEIPNKMEDKWIFYRKKNNSFIDSLFTGLMRSTVECKSCKHRSITYDPFIDLNVSINKYKNLEKCLKQYFEYEKIDCEYKCDNCKQISKVSIFIIIFFLSFI